MSRQLTHAQVNWLIRGVLLVVALAAFGLTALAAHPAYRYLGGYPAVLNTPQSIFGENETVAAYVTMIDPAVVSFPADWKLADRICAALRFDRGNAPTALPFSEYVPQIKWDEKPDSALIIDGNSIDGRAADGSFMTFENEGLTPYFGGRTTYRVQWFGQSFYPLYTGESAGGLTCVKFQFGDGAAHVPLFFFLRMTVKNVHIERMPTYYFRYNDTAPSAKEPPQTITLQRQDVNDYLARLAADAPFAVQPLNASQADQRATETSFAQP